jgi:hypothetical protein
MKRIKSMALAALAVLLVATYLLPAQPVEAQSSAALSIAPKKNYIVDPGESINDTLLIRNIDTANELQLYLRVIDFTYTDQGGTPKLFLDPNEPQKTWSAKPFLNVPETVTVPAGGNRSVDISVNLPANQGAGSYYSAIIYSTNAPDGGNVGLAASGVTLAFISVPGQVREDLLLKQFGAYDINAQGGDNGYRYIMGDEPKQLAYTIENRGNVTASPVGSITLRDMFGGERTIADINPNESLALIGQTRTFTACIEIEEVEVNLQGSNAPTNRCASPGLWPGLYTATLDLFYGQNGNNTNEIVRTTHFWYLPLWFVVILVLILLVIAYFIWRLVRKIKARNNGKIKLSSARRRRK